MDLLNEYDSIIEDGFLPAFIKGNPVRFKVEDGSVIIKVCIPQRWLVGRSEIVRIEIPDLGQSLELVGIVRYAGQDVYKLEVVQYREVTL